jgi:hypothetical protein
MRLKADRLKTNKLTIDQQEYHKMWFLTVLNNGKSMCT